MRSCYLCYTLKALAIESYLALKPSIFCSVLRILAYYRSRLTRSLRTWGCYSLSFMKSWIESFQISDSRYMIKTVLLKYQYHKTPLLPLQIILCKVAQRLFKLYIYFYRRIFLSFNSSIKSSLSKIYYSNSWTNKF